MPRADQQLLETYVHGDGSGPDSDETAEWVLPVRWIVARPQEKAYREKGMFANQNNACKLRQEFTLERLARHFELEDEG